MKTLKMIIGLLISIGIIYGLTCWIIPRESLPFMNILYAINHQTHGEDVVMRGLNMGNAFDAPNSGDWGVNIRPEYFEIIHSAGFNTVRLPVRFSGHMQTLPPYKIDPEFLTQVDEMVNAGLQNELVIILDVHHYAEIMKNPTEQEARFLALWRQLSEHYQTYSKNLYFELLNEPSDRLNKDAWNLLLTKAVQVVRQKDPVRKILIDASEYSDIEMLPTLKLPKDDNLIATFHFYEPFPFTHQGADWVEGSKRWQGTTWQGSEDERAFITEKLDRAAAWSREYHIPIVMGEFGAIDKADKASRVRWTSYLAREAEKYSIGWIHWQFCSDFPVYSCDKDEWDNDMLKSLIPD
jgi:endoglucanase